MTMKRLWEGWRIAPIVIGRRSACLAYRVEAPSLSVVLLSHLSDARASSLVTTIRSVACHEGPRKISLRYIKSVRSSRFILFIFLACAKMNER